MQANSINLFCSLEKLGMWCHLSLAMAAHIWPQALCIVSGRESTVLTNRFVKEDPFLQPHYSDVIMSVMASQITGFSTVYSIVCSSADQRKHQSSASLAFGGGNSPVTIEFPTQRPVTQTMFPFDYVIMHSIWRIIFSPSMKSVIRPWLWPAMTLYECKIFHIFISIFLYLNSWWISVL